MSERWDINNEFDWQEAADTPLTVEESGEEPVEITAASPHTRSRLKLFGAVLATFALGAGIGDLVTHTHVIKKGRNSYYVNVFSDVTTQTIDKSPTGCPPVSNRAINNVREILRRPENPAIYALREHFSSVYKDGLEDTEEYRMIAEAAARTHDFTLVDERPYIIRLDSLVFKPQKQLEVINEFAANYGFSVSIDTGADSDGVKSIDPWDVADYDFMGVFNYLAKALRFLPVEEVKAIGLKHLVIVKDFTDPNGKDNNVAAEAVSPGGLIQADIGALDSYNASGLMYHEMGHLDNYRFCGNFGFSYYDPQYDHLNPGNFEYGTGGYWQNATISDYGSSNIHEDEAEMSAEMLGGLDYDAAHSSYRAIRAKYDLLLARLNEQVPGIADYLQTISVWTR